MRSLRSLSLSARGVVTSSSLLTTTEMSFHESLKLMEQNNVYHLCIVEKALGFRGMLSVSDLVRVMATDEKARADLLEAYLFPPR